jgi:hypothetical protein
MGGEHSQNVGLYLASKGLELVADGSAWPTQQ